MNIPLLTYTAYSFDARMRCLCQSTSAATLWKVSRPRPSAY